MQYDQFHLLLQFKGSRSVLSVGKYDITQWVFNNRKKKEKTRKTNSFAFVFCLLLFHILNYSTHLKTQLRYRTFFDNIYFLTKIHARPWEPFISEKGSLYLLLLTIKYFCGETIVLNEYLICIQHCPIMTC